MLSFADCNLFIDLLFQRQTTFVADHDLGKSSNISDCEDFSNEVVPKAMHNYL